MALSGVSSALFDGTIGGTGSVYVDQQRSNWLLGNAIPALTLPTGGEKGADFERFRAGVEALNMNDNMNSWPRERIAIPSKEWWHSDIKDVAFPFTYKVIEELLINGGLN